MTTSRFSLMSRHRLMVNPSAEPFLRLPGPDFRQDHVDQLLVQLREVGLIQFRIRPRPRPLFGMTCSATHGRYAGWMALSVAAPDTFSCALALAPTVRTASSSGNSWQSSGRRRWRSCFSLGARLRRRRAGIRAAGR